MTYEFVILTVFLSIMAFLAGWGIADIWNKLEEGTWRGYSTSKKRSVKGTRSPSAESSEGNE